MGPIYVYESNKARQTIKNLGCESVFDSAVSVNL